jgi:transcription elongation GreA/GreB family factor
MDAPLARALLGQSLHASISIMLPEGERRYTIVAISYEPAD